MELRVPPAETGRAGLRALKSVALADGTLHDLEKRFIESIDESLLHVGADVDELEPITPAELAHLVVEPEFRQRVIRGCILVALIDSDASPAELAVVEGFRAALGADRAPLRDFRRIVNQKLFFLRLDIARRSFIGKRVKHHLAAKGLRGLVEAIRALQGGETPALAARYRTLDDMPEGTLGRGYADFIERNQFSYPGEVGGAPEPILFHDCVHVLAEYDTTPFEETLAAAFQAGFQKYDPFFSLLFAFAQFQLGLQISPIAGVEKDTIEPASLLQAFVRGIRCRVDLSDGWDPWAHFDRPVVELRAEYAIEPR